MSAEQLGKSLRTQSRQILFSVECQIRSIKRFSNISVYQNLLEGVVS